MPPAAIIRWRDHTVEAIEAREGTVGSPIGGPVNRPQPRALHFRFGPEAAAALRDLFPVADVVSVELADGSNFEATPFHVAACYFEATLEVSDAQNPA